MYAIIRSAGHQVKVSPGDLLEIDRMAGEPGTRVTFDEVLFIEKDTGEIVAGAPCVPGAQVTAVIDGDSRGPKIRVFKKKRRKGYRRTRGHRSALTRLRIDEIRA